MDLSSIVKLGDIVVADDEDSSKYVVIGISDVGVTFASGEKLSWQDLLDSTLLIYRLGVDNGCKFQAYSDDPFYPAGIVFALAY